VIDRGWYVDELNWHSLERLEGMAMTSTALEPLVDRR
jgi:hypothetical protein